MPRDNSFSDSDQETPKPRGWEGGDSDFGIIRMVDGHDIIPTTEQYGPEEDETRMTRKNCHYPNYEEDSLY